LLFNLIPTFDSGLVKAAPNLHTLHLRHPPVVRPDSFPAFNQRSLNLLSQSDLPLLASFKKLQILKVDLGPNPSQQMEECREAARKVLSSMLPLPSGKKRQLWYTLHEASVGRYESNVFQWVRGWKEEKYDIVEYI